MVFGVDLARKGKLEPEKAGLPGLDPLLARLLGLAPVALEFFALALLLLVSTMRQGSFNGSVTRCRTLTESCLK